MALDVGLTNFGAAIFEIPSGNLLDVSAIITKPGKKTSVTEDNARRCKEIWQWIDTTYMKYSPKSIVAEIPSGSKSNIAARAMALASGILYGFCESKNVTPFLLSPRYCQQTVCGQPTKDKQMVQSVVRKEYPQLCQLLRTMKTKKHIEAASDAVQCGTAFIKGKKTAESWNKIGGQA